MRRTDLSPRVRLILLETDSDWDDLLTAYAKSPAEERDILRRILSIVRSRGCNALIVEDEYVDRDYRAEFASIYSRVHRAPSRSTTRLLFLALSPEQHAAGRLGGSEIGDESALPCLGYTVLRPLRVGRVGRSFVAPPVWPDNVIVTCRAADQSHIGHQRFVTDGSPFIHQDAMVMVCAQAAIWTSLRYLHLQYGATPFLPSDITERAYRNLSWHGSPVPTAGLTLHHMVNAIAHVGFSPVFRTFAPAAPSPPAKPAEKRRRVSDVLRFVMPYLESHLPVILVLPEHAVCAVGYVLGHTLVTRVDYVQRLADWVSALVVHDDAVGPYRILSREVAPSGASFMKELRPFISTHYLESVLAAIVPLPQRVHSTADAIEEHLSSLLKASTGHLAEVATYSKARDYPSRTRFQEWEHAWHREGDDRITIRTYLMDTIEYLRALRTPDFSGFNTLLRERYSNSDWPRSVWVSELIPRARMEDLGDRRVIGEVISDPTANRYEAPFLAIHLPGFLIDLHELDKAALYPLADDEPYSFGSASAAFQRERSL